MSRPFEGVRIIDFTRVLAGPFATQQPALLGADVVKIEALGGDEMRYGSLSKEWMDRGMSPGWMAVNAQPDTRSQEAKSDRDRQTADFNG